MNLRRECTDLMQQRTNMLNAAEVAYDAGNQAEYDSCMEKVRNMGDRIQSLQADIAEQDRKFALRPGPTGAEARDIAEERGSLLMKGDAVKFTTDEIRRVIMNQITLASGDLVKPSGVDPTIRDPIGNVVSSIVDQVTTMDLTGLGSYSVPYVISELKANAGKIETLAGTARAVSADPTLGVAEIKPYELNVTTYVDRNISDLTPVGYYEKVHGMAMRALRRELANLIVNGDSEATHVMYGMKNATNKKGEAIYASLDVSAIDANTLDELYFSYGDDDYVGANARLLLHKRDLRAFGKLRGTNEKRRLLKISRDAGNANIGNIDDGGVIIPYTLVSGLTSLSTATAGDAAIQTMIYGDPANYLLGLFGQYSVRVDESVKAVERMLTILGDAKVGGNLTVDQGAVVATLPAMAAE